MGKLKVEQAVDADGRMLDRCLDAVRGQINDPLVAGTYVVLVLDDGRVMVGISSPSGLLAQMMEGATEDIASSIGAAIVRGVGVAH